MTSIGAGGSVPAAHARVPLARPPVPPPTDKPTWVDALEESLLLAIGLFALITWVITVGLFGH